MCRTCSEHEGDEESINFAMGMLDWEEQGVNMRMILKCILKKSCNGFTQYLQKSANMMP
jgi:hypothetical protein